ncbi:hypothetical protein HID58_015678, partial [Brassica napus]
LVSQPFPRPDQIEILLAFKNEFPILKCDFKKLPSSRKLTKSWTRNDVKSFSGVFFDSETGVVTVLKMRGACLSGTLNANSSLFRLHHLRYLDLSFNYLDLFPFLPQLGKLTNLESLDLSHMGLPGEIPSSISSLNRLTKLDLSDNELTGTFSPLLNLSRLSSLSLSNNLLSGNVPCSLLTMPFLSTLHLSNNHLTVSLETMNCSSSSKLETLYLGNNRLSEYLNVEGNRITDTFPFWLEELPNLKIIVLRSNMFHGPIYSPQHPLSFPELRMFDISRNNFTGSLPHDYFVNWSTPLLSAPQKIPQSTQFGGQPKSSFEGNLNLCGRPLLESCFQDKVPSTPEAQELEPSKQEQVFNWKAAAMGYGPGVLFGLAIGQVLYSYKPVLFFKLFRL